MKKYIKLILFLLVLIPFNVFAESNYYLKKYDVNIIVNKNNTFDITEKITAYFNNYMHGIYRKIPLTNNITRLDGTNTSNRVKITNLNVSDNYITSNENDNYVIKIGSADSTIIGSKDYVISYTYNIGKDPLKDIDEFYYNIIGDSWDTSISNITFKITMPESFDSTKLGFSSGIVGSSNSNNISYHVNDKIITGTYTNTLPSYNALTIRLELPEGYFENASFNFNFSDYLFIILPILFLIISCFLWNKYGRDKQVVETIEFYPPEGLNSLEVGYLYRGKASNQDVISLLIYLANKGYIKITEIEEQSFLSTTKGFKINKIKEYDGNNMNEKIFLDGLFSKIESLFNVTDENMQNNNITEVSSFDLYDNFYRTIDKILDNLNNKDNENKIFEKKPFGGKIFIILMIIVTFCIITIPPVLDSDFGLSILPFALLFPSVGFTIMITKLFGKKETIYINNRPTNSSIANILFGLAFGILFGGFPWAVIVLPMLLQNSIYMINYIVGIICNLGMIICLEYFSKRTSYGNEILGKLKGFKTFLETAEKEQLESMVEKNPTYFYDILPYAYVLDVSNKWIKKFEVISLQAPMWYDSNEPFTIDHFNQFMHTTMVSAESSMSSSSTSTMGGSSGGGSSGGGSGGGGGGSW